MNIIFRLIFCLLCLSIPACGPAFVIVGALAGINMEKRCIALEKQADKEKLTSMQTRHLLLENNCRTYLEKYYSRNN